MTNITAWHDFVRMVGLHEPYSEALLEQAMTHKSYAADFKQHVPDNERLEFLGDAVLWAAINKLLYQHFPDLAESSLTLYKIALVREETLARVARNVGLPQLILVSKGEEKVWGRDKDVILADCLEAFLWFLFLEFSFDVALLFVEKYIFPLVHDLNNIAPKSAKTLLQEWTQAAYKQIPHYVDAVSRTDTKGNALEYSSQVYVHEKLIAEWIGPNKKKAQENAAAQAYPILLAWK